jgi:signal transduction histidine kinase
MSGPTISTNVHAAYRRDAAALTARNLGLAAAVFVAFVGAGGLVETLSYPRRALPFALIFGGQAALGSLVYAFRERLRQREWIIPLCVILSAAMALSVNLYAWVVGGPSELTAIGLLCLMCGLPFLFPWGARGQIVVAAAAFVGFAVTLAAIRHTSPWTLNLFGLAAGACVSVIGAHYLDLHRWAIFRETMLKDHEAKVAQALLEIADDLNTAPDARTLMRRLTRSTRRALGSDWSLVMLWDERRRVFEIAATSGAGPRAETSPAVEYVPSAFPILERAVRDTIVTITDLGAADPVTAAFMQRYRTEAMILTALRHGGRVIGLLVTGLQQAATFPEGTHRLLRGIAHQAAIALENVRLVADLRHADRMKSEFVATMSHELRTPLNVILGYNELLLDGAFGHLSTEQRTIVERVQASSSDLLDLINATLNVNKLQAGQAALQLEPVPLRVFLDDLTAEAERLPRSPEVTLHWACEAAGGTIRTDPAKLKLIIKNLLHNALKFTERGQVTVRVQRTGETADLDISVSDTGVGIAAAELPHIFEMFRQAASSERPSAGVGLGLYIVQRYVEMLGGTIDVQSSLGVGSTFRVRLPARAAEQRAA